MATTWFCMIGTPFTGIGISSLLSGAGLLEAGIPDRAQYVRISIEPYGRNEGLLTGPQISKDMFASLVERDVHAIFVFIPPAAWKNSANRLTGATTFGLLSEMIAQGITWVRSYGLDYSQFSIEPLPGPDDKTTAYMTPLEYAKFCADIAAADPKVNLVGPGLRTLPVGRDVYTEAFFQCQDVLGTWGACGFGSVDDIKQRLTVTAATMNAVNIGLPKLITQFGGAEHALEKVACFLAQGFSAALLDQNSIPDEMHDFLRDHPLPGLIYRSEELSEQDRTVKILLSSMNHRRMYLLLCRPGEDDGTQGELQLVIQNGTWTRVDRIVNLAFAGPGHEHIRCTPRVSDGVTRLTLRNVPFSGSVITCTWEVHGPEMATPEPGPPEPPSTGDEKDYVTMQTIVQLPVYRGTPVKTTYENGTIFYDSLANDIKVFWDGAWRTTQILEYV